MKKRLEAPTHDEMDLGPQPGDTLPNGTPLLKGQYIVDGYLNSGGFGITYYARDSLDRRVVLKECFPSSMCCRTGLAVNARTSNHQSEFETVVRLFGQEARRLAKLSHPNIVGVRDVFEENGTAYMALDLIEGRDLQDVVTYESWRLTPETIRSITLALLDAIGHVHARGMLHRDISPDNVLLDEDNTPVLIDFGAARDNARRKTRVLSTMHVVKDGFSPQEFYLQAGDHLPASDLFSLAATIYMAITGRPPIVAHQRLAAIAERQPDPYEPLAGNIDGFDDRFLRMIDKSLSVFSRDRPKEAAEWLAGIAAADPAQPSTDDEREIAERIRRLVEATNPEVRRVQEQREKERAESRRLEAEELARKEEARRNLLERARLEALEAEEAARERALREAQERKARAEEEERARRRAQSTNAEGIVDPSSVVRVPEAAGVNRAKLLREREERARAERLKAAEEGAKPGRSVPADPKKDDTEKEAAQAEKRGQSRGSFFSRVLSRGQFTKESGEDSTSEGYGT